MTEAGWTLQARFVLATVRCGTFAAALLLGAAPGVPAWAASEDERIGRLEKRIQELEARLARAERGTASAKPLRKARSPAVSPPSEAETTVPAAAPTQPAVALPAGEPPSDAPQKPQRDLTPSEFNVFRDNAATLRANKFELSVGTAYEKRSSPVQRDRAVPSYATLRYGLLDGVELSATVPYYFSQRSSDVGVGRTVDKDVSSFGDASAQVNALLFKETVDYPGVVATAGVSFPTGDSPLTFGPGFKIGYNPIDPFRAYDSRGDWSGQGSIQVYKTLDPIILFGGVGFDYAFPQSVRGYHVSYSPRVSYNMGFAFAVNEKTTIGFQVNGAAEGAFDVNGKPVQGTAQEPIVARVVLVQRVAQDTYLEPTVGFGLTPAAPDVSIGFTLRRRF